MTWKRLLSPVTDVIENKNKAFFKIKKTTKRQKVGFLETLGGALVLQERQRNKVRGSNPNPKHIKYIYSIFLTLKVQFYFNYRKMETFSEND